MFEINGETWHIQFSCPYHDIFIMDNGDYTIGVCDDITKTILSSDEQFIKLINRLVRIFKSNFIFGIIKEK